MVKQGIKSALRTLFPAQTERWLQKRQRDHIRRVEEGLGLPQVIAAYTDRQGFKVSAGPFAGTQYVRQAAGSTLLPKLIGSYELELHPAVEEIVRQNPAVVVDVGCAEGYYAIGFARRLPHATVYAFDTDLVARSLCTEMATLNEVADRVKVRGACDPQALQAIPGANGMLLISDCEGYERELLRPDLAPCLTTATILVELHEHIVPGLADTLQSRFAPTHAIQFIASQPRDPAAYPQTAFLPAEQRAVAVGEFRNPAQRWAVLLPHGAATSSQPTLSGQTA